MGETTRCWRSECRTTCYYPDACSESSIQSARPATPMPSPTLAEVIRAFIVSEVGEDLGDGMTEQAERLAAALAEAGLTPAYTERVDFRVLYTSGISQGAGDAAEARELADRDRDGTPQRCVVREFAPIVGPWTHADA